MPVAIMVRYTNTSNDLRFPGPTLFARCHGVMDGEMCILGSRIPIRYLWDMRHRFGMSVDQIHHEYPHLLREEIEDAIARVEYARDRDERRRWAKLGKKALRRFLAEEGEA